MTNEILDAINERRTISFFDPSAGISDEQIEELVNMATKAPSSFNLQNWRFVAVRSPEDKARLRKVGWDQPKITEAAVTFVVIGQPADHRDIAKRLAPAVANDIMSQEIVEAWEGGAKKLYFEQPQRAHDEGVRSATLGATTLMFAAHSIGLHSAPMIGFEPEGVSEEFGLADDEFPVMLLAVGKATAENWPQKPRRPLSEVLEII